MLLSNNQRRVLVVPIICAIWAMSSKIISILRIMYVSTTTLYWLYISLTAVFLVIKGGWDGPS